MTQKGYILIVDITGYTAYLSQTELAHAQEILEALMNTLVDHIHPPMIISRVEGDGVFAYTLDNCFLQGQTLLEALEHLYCSFAFELAHIKRNTTCTCQACKRIPELGLKMIAHYGEFGLQNIGQRTDLVGTDVNLTHRLAKNSVKEKTGVSDYAFFTTACIDALHLRDFAEKTMVFHTETYEHIGGVEGFVYDLYPVWQRDLERRRVILPPEEIEFETSMFLPVSPPIAWDYLLDPGIRTLYLGADKIDTSKVDGRMMAGSQYHCAHGDVVLDQIVLDWQPFEYFTIEQNFFLPGNMKGSARSMTRLEESSGGTLVTNYYTRGRASNPLARLMLRMMWGKMKEMVVEGNAATERIILEAIEAAAKPDMPLIKMPAQAV
jgi:hypothetical protein